MEQYLRAGGLAAIDHRPGSWPALGNLPEHLNRVQLTDDEYHSPACVGITRGDLVAALRSPKHYVSGRRHFRHKTSAALDFGRAYHLYILEPEVFARKYRALNGSFADGRTNEGKAQRAEIEKTGVTLLEEQVMDTLVGMRDALYQSKFARRLFQSGLAEYSILWNDTEHDLICKCRPDFLTDRFGLFIDLKTTNDASPDRFAKDIFNYNYYGQIAHYSSGVLALRGSRYEGIIVAQEHDPPYAVAFYDLDTLYLESGENWRNTAMRAIRQASDADDLAKAEGYPDELQSVSAPAWIKF